jgi:phosphatidylglycerophosphatase C
VKRVVFDFDGTIAAGDAVGSWIHYRIMRSPVRFLLALLALPVSIPLLALYPTLGASLFLWIATVGLAPAAVGASLEAFAVLRFGRPDFLFAEALDAIARHQAAGDHVVIASGCEFRLLSWVGSRVGLTSDSMVGSTLRQRLLGSVAQHHCVGARKVEMLRERTGFEAYDHVYTDSWRDLPLMQRARSITLVNAKPALVARVRAATGVDVVVVTWGQRTALPLRQH